MKDWDVSSALALYNVERWGSPYFTVNPAGHVAVRPDGEPTREIDMMELLHEARERGLSFPITLRFQDLLRHRVQTVNRAFAEAIAESGYKNVYRGVFPIKVNQLREVVEEVVDAGAEFHFGLEAGSKPELLAALSMHDDPESLIICNGYKDADYVRNAMLGRKLGKRLVMVVEKIEELTQILSVAKQMDVEPWIGVRVRLATKGAGKWATSGGEDAKFGLSTAELVEASELLRREGMARSSAPCAKPRGFTPSCRNWDTTSVTLMSAAGSASITMARAPRSTARSITRCMNTPAMWSPPCRKSATRKRSRIRCWSAKADAPSPRTIPCSSSRPSALSKKFPAGPR
jgi:hypothetical protein